MRDKADPPSAVGGLKVIDKRVGSWGKKEKQKKKDKHRRINIRRSMRRKLQCSVGGLVWENLLANPLGYFFIFPFDASASGFVSSRIGLVGFSSL